MSSQSSDDVFLDTPWQTLLQDLETEGTQLMKTFSIATIPLKVRQIHLICIIPLYTGNPLTSTLVNSEDPDKMLQRLMQHFIRVFTVCYDKINLQGLKYTFIWNFQYLTLYMFNESSQTVY